MYIVWLILFICDKMNDQNKESNVDRAIPPQPIQVEAQIPKETLVAEQPKSHQQAFQPPFSIDSTQDHSQTISKQHDAPKTEVMSQHMTTNSVETTANTSATYMNTNPPIQPLLDPEISQQVNLHVGPSTVLTGSTPGQEPPPQPSSPQKVIVTKVKLSDELNIFDWLRATDIINQIAEKAKHSVDSVITALDPGMKEYLYSGGNINIIVISDSSRMVNPIRDTFQSVFGRATVVAARYNPPEAAEAHPVKLACGFDEAIVVAQERIKKLRLDTNNVPQNQVVVVVQPTLVQVVDSGTAGNRVTNGLKLDDDLLPRWFLTYSMLIEDPVLGATMNSFSQFIPIDSETVSKAKEFKFPEDYKDNHLGYAITIDELMRPNSTHNPPEENSNEWLQEWAGLDEIKILHDLSNSLAHMYRRKWNDCIVK